MSEKVNSLKTVSTGDTASRNTRNMKKNKLFIIKKLGAICFLLLCLEVKSETINLLSRLIGSAKFVKRCETTSSLMIKKAAWNT